jgi:hypothetical protein
MSIRIFDLTIELGTDMMVNRIFATTIELDGHLMLA